MKRGHYLKHETLKRGHYFKRNRDNEKGSLFKKQDSEKGSLILKEKPGTLTVKRGSLFKNGTVKRGHYLDFKDKTLVVLNCQQTSSSKYRNIFNSRAYYPLKSLVFRMCQRFCGGHSILHTERTGFFFM